jgi:hypothetical protein
MITGGALLKEEEGQQQCGKQWPNQSMENSAEWLFKWSEIVQVKWMKMVAAATEQARVARFRKYTCFAFPCATSNAHQK